MTWLGPPWFGQSPSIRRTGRRQKQRGMDNGLEEMKAMGGPVEEDDLQARIDGRLPPERAGGRRRLPRGASRGAGTVVAICRAAAGVAQNHCRAGRRADTDTALGRPPPSEAGSPTTPVARFNPRPARPPRRGRRRRLGRWSRNNRAGKSNATALAAATARMVTTDAIMTHGRSRWRFATLSRSPRVRRRTPFNGRPNAPGLQSSCRISPRPVSR